MAKEYIEREAAKEAARRAECDANYDGRKFDAECVECAIDFAPAADVVPVRHGRWIKSPDCPEEYDICSVCGKNDKHRSRGNWEHDMVESVPPFCKWCGARMDIEELEGKYYLMKKTSEWLKEKVPRWIPVTERLPEMGKEVLVSDKHKGVNIAWIVGCFSKDGASFEWACESDGWIDDQLPITHWMPLPEPPKEET